MTPKPTRPSHRLELLGAATRVVLRDGLLALTLDAVAREAGLSKGGVLYHFRTKEELVAGMVRHFLDEFEREVALHEAADPEPAGRWLRAYLAATFAPPGVADGPSGLPADEARRLYAALLAAVVLYPELLPPVREALGRWQARMAEGGDPAEALVTWLALDGLWTWEMFGLALPDALRGRVLEVLRQRTRPEGP